ncbi:hypothetical protein CDEF62S_02770 [Castellaniella defragrans]
MLRTTSTKAAKGLAAREWGRVWSSTAGPIESTNTNTMAPIESWSVERHPASNALKFSQMGVKSNW